MKAAAKLSVDHGKILGTPRTSLPVTGTFVTCRQMLSKISRVWIKFAPLRGDSYSARELLSRFQTDKAYESNPDCDISFTLRRNCDPKVEIEFANGHIETIGTQDLNIDQLLERIKERSRTLEAQDVLKKAGFLGIKLDVGHTSKHVAGKARRIPTF